jgi:hypothetical protein
VSVCVCVCLRATLTTMLRLFSSGLADRDPASAAAAASEASAETQGQVKPPPVLFNDRMHARVVVSSPACCQLCCTCADRRTLLAPLPAFPFAGPAARRHHRDGADASCCCCCCVEKVRPDLENVRTVWREPPTRAAAAPAGSAGPRLVGNGTVSPVNDNDDDDVCCSVF